MLRLTPLLGLFAAALACAQSEPLPDLPDPLGRAGMMAAVLRETDGSEVIVATGGTNFPDKMPWQGGQRKYHKDILKLSRKDGVWSWHKIGDLPEGLVGAAFCPTPKRDGLIIAGGASAVGHRADVWLVSLDGKVTRFSESMARPRAYAGFTATNGHLIVIGGIERPDDTTAIATLTSLDLDDPDKPWRTSDADSSYGRIIPLVGAGLRTLVWGGGCSLSEKDGKPFRSYHENLAYQSTDGEGNRFHGLPNKLAGAAGPGVLSQTHLFFVGGDDGTQYGQPYETHTGLARRILVMDLETFEVTDVGEWPHPVAVAPLLRLGDDLVTVSGEVRPGVRTPKLTRWPIPAKYR
jgi:N-acetylneuraminic acid mutarotase